MLNPQQQEAYDSFVRFLDDPQQTMFCLFGRAGTGKSFTSSRMFGEMQKRRQPLGEMVWAAPTWKAVRVASGFLDGVGADFEIGYDYYMHRRGRMIATTTQQSLGIRPIITENQTEEVTFGDGGGGGILGKLGVQFVVVDEVSMLSWDHLKRIHMEARGIGAKVLVIGDPGQLPPVQAKEIKWDKLPNRYELTQIMRQAGDSAIPVVAGMVRDGDDGWRGFSGEGVRREVNVAGAFLSEVGFPSEDESERDVFVAYRNALVDRVQDEACKRVYGHGMHDFQVDEPVIAQGALYAGRTGMVIANQDELVVREIGDVGRWGRKVVVELKNGRQVRTEYLSGADMVQGAWAQELKRLKSDAIELQNKFKAGDRSVDKARRAAWVKFFEHKDQTVLNFAHVFAITSHKSQGSTYRRAFVAAEDIARFDQRGLYVAMTRPKEELVY